MSSAIAEAQTFFTSREALLESLSLSAVHKPQAATGFDSTEEVHLKLGSPEEEHWGVWLTRRMRDYLKSKQLTLLYVHPGQKPEVQYLFNPRPETSHLPLSLLARLTALKPGQTPRVKRYG